MAEMTSQEVLDYLSNTDFSQFGNQAASTGTDFLGGLLGGVGNFLGGTGGQLLGTGLGIDALNELRGLGSEAQTEALRIGNKHKQIQHLSHSVLVQVLVVYKLVLKVVTLLLYLHRDKLNNKRCKELLVV